jgi:hypothetical protein
MGVDAYNPLEAKAGMDVRGTAPSIRPRIGFCGNSDIQVWETGDRDAIRREVLRKLNAAKGGGYIFQSDHSVSSAVSGHTYDYIVQLVREHGNYPIQLGEFEEAGMTLSAAPIDDFNVVWDSPSRDHHGSMPLGWGTETLPLNAWMTADGDLHFYIGKTDAWDDNARLLKVGKVRVRFEPNPVAPGLAFRQELKLNEGCLEITTGTIAATGSSVAPHPHTTIRIWVDANHPVIHVTADSATPLEAVASVELWRTNQYETESQVSDVLLNRKLGPIRSRLH